MSTAPALRFENYVEIQPESQPTRVYQPQTWFTQPTVLKKSPRPATAVHLVWETIKTQSPKDFATKGLDDTYVIEDRPSVARFIEEYRLHGLLLQASEPLKARFGADSIKTLSLISDDEGFESLFCVITAAGNIQQNRQTLRNFDREWWLSRAKQALGRLNFDFKLI